MLLINFTTVTEYLFLLQSVSRILEPLGEECMYYLAAAVSDFFIPAEKMVCAVRQLGWLILYIYLNRETNKPADNIEFDV